MLTQTEIKMLNSRLFFDSFNKIEYKKTAYGIFIVNVCSCVYAIEEDLFNRFIRYMENQMVLLTADNQFSLGMAKLIIVENNLEIKYHSEGYLLSRKDYSKYKLKFESIIDLEIRSIT